MKNHYWSYVWLAIGILLLIFSNGKWVIPLAAWLAPVFILRFTHTQKPFFGLAFSLLAYIVTYIFIWSGVIPMEGVLYYLIAGGIGLLVWLPYLADRLITPRLPGAWATLVFPLAWVTVEFVVMLTSPFSTWAALAYTQYGNLPLVQIVSVTGLGGIAFLITWFASTANWAWEQDFVWPRVGKMMGLYGFIFALIMLLGGARLILFAPRGNTVQVASIIGAPPTRALWLDALINPPPSAENCNQILDEYLERSRQQAKTGAKIITWEESAIFVPQGQETAFVERARRLADEENIYLLMTLMVPSKEDAEMLKNKAIWIDPEGKIAWEYLKSKIVPGDNQIPGDGRLKTSDTPYGKVSAAICFDIAHPTLIRQTGNAGADILFTPSDTWRDSSSLHMQIASFRAVENGVSVVQATTEGLSATFDYQGRVLATLDYFTSGGGTMTAFVPTRGAKTVYARIGDLFSWLCAAGLLAVIAAAFWTKRR